jgi:hypothetical protein
MLRKMGPVNRKVLNQVFEKKVDGTGSNSVFLD